jgi:hypothetical protein
MGLNEIYTWLKENSFLITLIASILTICTMLGFKIDVRTYFSNLTLEGKIVFYSVMNLLITALSFTYLLGRIKKLPKKNR